MSSRYIIQLRRGTTEQWANEGKDIIPLAGELVLEYDNGVPRLKIGNGEDVYGALPYISVDSFVLPTPTTIILRGGEAWKNDPESGGYMQDITEQLKDKITQYSKIDLQPTPEQLSEFYKKDVTFTTINEDGQITVYAIGIRPENDYTIQVTITEVAVDG